jgi:hypothetical protein
VVVLPASMWAINPIFRTRSSGVCRDKLVHSFFVLRFSFFVFQWIVILGFGFSPKTKNEKP